MTGLQETVCPGCGLKMPPKKNTAYRSYYRTNAECWDLYTEVLGTEYSNAILFGQVHQLTVDAYAAQHAGEPHPDKSVDIHLCGLHLALVKGIRSPHIPPLLQRIATEVDVWPNYEPPTDTGPLTIFDVAFSESTEDHIRIVRAWAEAVWASWADHHADVARLVSHHLKMD